MTGRTLFERETAPYVCDNQVSFYVHLPEAKQVSVVGSFNAWKKEALLMKRAGNGWWMTDPVTLPAPARHLYRFLLDGEKFYDDPLNFNKTQNKHGPAAFVDTWADIPGVLAQLDGIHEALIQNPPGTGNAWIRDMCSTFVDDYLQQPNVNRSSTIRDFLVKRIRTALDEIDRTRIKNGVRVWHIYNDGYIFKTPTTCFGIDVVTTRHIWNLAWDMPDDIPYRIAGCLDMLLVTHEHSDHADHELVSRLLTLKKPVVVPVNIQGKFAPGAFGIEPWARKIVRGQNIMSRPGVHVYDKGRNVHCITFEMMTDNGVRIYHTGDHDYAESLSWQATPDILIPKFDGVSPKYPNEKVLEILFGYGDAGLIIPGHINELAHYPLGGRTSLRDAMRQFQNCKIPYQILLWGESYLYT